MKVLLDCDVLLDVALGRMPFARHSRAVLDWWERHPGSGFIAWHTVANLYYLMRQGHDDDSRRQFIRDLLNFVDVVPSGTAETKHALALEMGDFEDAMQAAAAVQAGVDFIATRNTGDYRSSPIPAMMPAEFLSQAPP